MLQIEYDFTLPRGYVGEDGTLHREGVMRLATAADEIIPLRDPRVRENPEYLSILILARVVVSLGSVQVTPAVIEGLFVNDLAFLQSMYNSINQMEQPAVQDNCPQCGHSVEIALNFQQAGR